MSFLLSVRCGFEADSDFVRNLVRSFAISWSQLASGSVGKSLTKWESSPRYNTSCWLHAMLRIDYIQPFGWLHTQQVAIPYNFCEIWFFSFNKLLLCLILPFCKYIDNFIHICYNKITIYILYWKEHYEKIYFNYTYSLYAFRSFSILRKQ